MVDEARLVSVYSVIHGRLVLVITSALRTMLI